MGSLFEQLNLWIWIGFIVQVVGRVAGNAVGPLAGLGISLLGLIIFIYGCMHICQDKGQSKWLGLLGIFSCIGLLIVLLLPEKQ